MIPASLRGRVTGRYGGLNIPELQQAGVSPGVAAEAIRRGKGRVFERIRDAAADQIQREGYVAPRRRSPGRPVVPPHPGNRKCTHCKGAHSTDQHRFHGEGSFHQTPFVRL